MSQQIAFILVLSPLSISKYSLLFVLVSTSLSLSSSLIQIFKGVVKTELTRHKNGSWSAAAANLFYVSLNHGNNQLTTIGMWKDMWLPSQAILSPALKSPKAGAQTSIFCAVDQSLDGVGAHFIPRPYLLFWLFVWFIWTPLFHSRCLASTLLTVQKGK